MASDSNAFWSFPPRLDNVDLNLTVNLSGSSEGSISFSPSYNDTPTAFISQQASILAAPLVNITNANYILKVHKGTVFKIRQTSPYGTDPAFDPTAPLPLTTQQIRVINDSPAIPFDVIMTATNAPNAGPPWSYTVPQEPPNVGNTYVINYAAGMWQLSALLSEVIEVLYSTNMSPATSLPVIGWTVEGPGGQTYITAV